MKIINFIKSLFVKQKKELNSRNETIEKNDDRQNLTSSDFIDYDGMGNQGRFPPKR